VQEFAIKLLMIGENHLRTEDFLDKLRLALITHDPNNMVKVYPKWDKREATEEDIQTTQGSSWEFEEFDPRDAEQILSDLLSNSSGRLTMADLGPDEGWQ
jgi:hypothetical protein